MHADGAGKPNNPLSGFPFFFFVKVILVAQISICFEGDVYEGQWKGDKANGEGGGSPAASSPQPSLPSIERCVSPC